MELNELKTIELPMDYFFVICKDDAGFIIMRFNSAQWGLNLSSEKAYKTQGQAITAGKNIINNHLKRKRALK